MIDTSILAYTGNIIGILSLVVTYKAFRHTVKKSEFKEWHQDLASKKMLSEAGEKYATLLNEVAEEFCSVMDEIKASSRKSHNKIYEHFNKYDRSAPGEPNLRHRFYNVTEAIRDAYDDLLITQPGLHIINRLRFLKHIEEDFRGWNKKGRTLKEALSYYFGDKRSPTSPEEALYASRRFSENVSKIYESFSKEEEPKLFSEIFPHIRNHLTTHEQHYEKLEELSKRLNKGIMENSREPIHIKEIPHLGRTYYQIKKDIERVKALWLIDMSGLDDIPVYDGVAYTIYSASVLYILSQYDLWGIHSPGWDYEDRRLAPSNS